MPDVFGTPIDQIPNVVMSDAPHKPKPEPKPRSARKIYNHPCAKCEVSVNSQGPRSVITKYDQTNARTTNYYHERCDPLKPKSFTEKLLGLFTRS